MIASLRKSGIVQRFRPSSRHKALILMYHRVFETENDPWGLCVAPHYFAEQLQILQEIAHPISLAEMQQQRKTKKIQDRSVVVTFDDGYADNLHYALPQLKRFQIPATIFLTSGYIGQDREFWWDELEQSLLLPPSLPKLLKLTIAGHKYEWFLAAGSDYSEAQRQQDRQKRPWEFSIGSRMGFYYSVWKALQPIAHMERAKLLEEIGRWAASEATSRPSHHALSWQEAQALANEPLIEIGAHTVTHPLLSALPTALQELELQQCKDELEARLQRPVTALSYPHGDHNAETLQLARKVGFSSACTVQAAPVTFASDTYQLPRIEVRNWNGETFACQLAAWWQ